ncbi:VanZ family protein [Halococcus morrhuae DSM 1307]|uniref:VanZ family protein n=1 Tax=Halococcus morrhuae DSM 1307 TaxID=931277 RepID=M0MZ92_HALMO|nr:VanZ family protein [Halococcus morrhuae]EMA49740.1 VanZ family protein [Halococcus morrhuae DSM 1307]
MRSPSVPLVDRRVRYALVVLVTGIVLVASVVETSGTPTVGPFGLVGMDKWTHALAYAGVTATLAYASIENGHARLALAVGLAIAFGIGIETVQEPIAYRTASVADVLADAIGACLLALGWRTFSRYVRFVPSDESRTLR